MSKRELLSPFTVTFLMAGGLVALLLLTSKKKTPINTVQGLPPYEGPAVVSGLPPAPSMTRGSIG